MDRLLAAAMIVVGLCLITVAVAHAHSAGTWDYDWICCAAHDCRPTDDVQEVNDGWIAEGSHVSRDKARPSKDHRYHICRPPGQNVRCLYIPLSG